MQKLFTLLIGGVILYLFAEEAILRFDSLPKAKSENKQPTNLKKESNTEETPDLEGNFLERTLSNVMLNTLKTEEGRFFLESLIKPIHGSPNLENGGFQINNHDFINAAFKIKSSGGQNTNKIASCGHIVTIHYQIFEKKLKIKDQVITYPLGSEKAYPGLDPIIVGMKIGETRTATISNRYLVQNKTEPLKIYQAKILLKELMPQNFADENIKIFDDEIAYKIPLMCGNRAVYQAKITDLTNGAVIFDSKSAAKKIDMHLGDLNYPMIFSHSLHNKIPVGTRTLITPGRFLKSFASNYSTIFPDKQWPEDHYFLIDFYEFEQTNPIKVKIAPDQTQSK